MQLEGHISIDICGKGTSECGLRCPYIQRVDTIGI